MNGKWEIKPLGEICDVLDRLRKPITKSDRKSGPYPYYGATGVLDHVDGFLFDEELILIGEDGAKWEAGENSAYPISGKSWVNNHAHVIRPHRSMVLDAWLIYFLNASDLMPFVSGLTVPKLNQARLREIPIPLPPLDEQRKIVAILDEAFEGIDRASENTNALLLDVQKLKRSILDGAFAGKLAGNCPDEWSLKPLGEICELRNGFAFKSETFKETGIPVLRISSIQNEEVCDNRPVYVDPSDYKENLEKYFVKEGDLLIAMSGATTGKVGFNNSDKTYLLNQRVGKFEPASKLNRVYLFYFLSTKVEDNLSISAGSAQPNLSTKQIKETPIPLPPLEQQVQLVEVLDQAMDGVKKVENNLRHKLADLMNLRQSLLQKAFAGELT